MAPVNCSSQGDINTIVNYVYDELHLDLDYVVPFAAIPEGGRDIGRIDQISEMAHRMMLTNVLRLLGGIKNAKSERGIETRPALVVMPCSPNHGVFGMDGLYSESKMGCESLVNKWQSEGWSNYLSICCCKIGWTRSALMWQNNIVAQGIEEMGCRTFSTLEQAYNLVGLFHPSMVQRAAEAPLWLDTTGGWQTIKDLKGASADLRAAVYADAAVKKALATEPGVKEVVDTKPSPAASWAKPTEKTAGKPLADPNKMFQKFPPLPSDEKRASLEGLKGMVDLDQTVVVTGFGEVGPWGNARTRWEMESTGEFSLEGCIELAWICGLIRPHSGTGVKGFDPRQYYVGWVDGASGEPVADHEVKKRYEETILEHSGIRLIEPDLFEGYDPFHKTLYHQVAIDKKMAPLEVPSRQEALDYRKELGEENVDIYQGEGGEWFVQLRPGSVIWIPRAMRFDRFVAGQIPTGWDAERYGVPKSIAADVDPVTLFTLVSTVEAFVGAGITDPYEFYQYVHVSEVGNCSGGGMGGMRSLKRLFHERKLEKEIPSDTLAESFINTMPAWINMLLLSSSGPIKTPVGACATAAESVEVGCETILSGKARVVIVGGYDDFGEEGSYEFAAMGATNNSATDDAAGRVPKEASRPMTSSRAGFVEAQGAGMQLLMDAALAIQMGCPIYGVIGLTNTATDREGRSVPAPGQGILTTARETKRVFPSPLLSLDYRRAQLEEELATVESWASAQRKAVAREVEELSKEEDGGNAEAYAAERLVMVERLVRKKRRGAYSTWGNTFYKNLPNIAPLRGALAVWGLTIDDVAVGSFHGTSTNANDRNESQVVHRQMEHLGRTRGNPIYCIAQKWLTGHPKGPAAAWMFNGVMQTVLSGIVPGNRNIDNSAPELQQYHHVAYPNRSIDIASGQGGMKAGLLKSFGFGQAGAEILVIHPDYLLSTLDGADFARYARLRGARENSAYRYQQGVISGKHTLIQVKSAPPYTEEQQTQVYLDPTARAAYDPVVGSWTFGGAHPPARTAAAGAKPAAAPKALTTRDRVDSATRLAATMQRSAEGLLVRGDRGVGVDIEPVSTFADLPAKQEFITRNFTANEIQYANTAADPSSSYAGRWAAKEAVVKAISSTAPNTPVTQGSDAALIDIEILSSDSGAPVVQMHGYAAEVMRVLGLQEVKVSISHADEVAVAQAIAR